MSTSEIAKLESRWRENPNGLTFAPLAEAYRKQKDPQRALEILTPGLEKHPDYIPANIVLGRCHWDLNDLPAAERAFTHVLGLDSENVIALKALADITERLVRYDESERWLGTLLAVDRSNDEARAQLARIHDLQQQRAEGSAVVREAEAAAAQVQAEPPLASPIEPPAPAPEPVEEAISAPEALERTPEPPEPGEVSSVEYIGWVARPDDLASTAAPLRVEDLDHTPAPYASDADDSPPSPSETPAEPEPSPTFDRPFVPPAFPDHDSFGFEQSEDIVLNVSGHSEYQTPSAVDDLLAQVTGTPSGIDNLRRDLAPPEPITSALPGFTTPVDDPFAPPVAESPAEPRAELASDRADAVHVDPPSPAALFGRTADFYGLDQPSAHEETVPTPEPAAMAAPEPVPVPEPVGELDDASPVGEPELVVTETMAEVFLRQGHLMEAITVYRELVRRTPGGEQLAGRLSELEVRQAAVAAPPPRPAYAARDTGGQSVASFFQSLLQTRPDDVAPRWPAQAPASQPESGPDDSSATRPAGEPLSLGSVFGEEAPPVAPAVGRPSGETSAPGAGTPGSFDDFFGSPPKSGGPPSPPATGRLHARSGDDLDQFHAWLQGLKR
ncbi:MAG TPA: tetratricopeptide repeat protein [Gemmatimonadales bacterium]